MRLSIVLYILCAYRACSGAPTGQGNANPGGPNVGTVTSITVDIAKLDSTICQSYEYDYDGNATRLILPKEGQSITKIVNGKIIIWTAQSGETLEYFKLYLDKKGKADLVLVTKRGSTGIQYIRSGSDGKECEDFNDRLDKLKVVTGSSTNITLDLSATQNTDQCTTFQTRLLGVNTRFFFPKNGHTAMEVKDGSATIWTSSGDEICLTCDLYLKDAQPSLILIVVKDGANKSFKCFEKMGSEWKSLEKNDFDAKRDSLKSDVYRQGKGATPGQPSDGLKLDLSNVDNNLFIINESTDREVKTSEYMPKSAYDEKIFTIVDGTVEVWKANVSDGESLENCKLHTKNGFPSLIHFTFRASNAEGKYMVKDASGKWRGISKTEFDEKLYGMKNNVQELKLESNAQSVTSTVRKYARHVSSHPQQTGTAHSMHPIIHSILQPDDFTDYLKPRISIMASTQYRFKTDIPTMSTSGPILDIMNPDNDKVSTENMALAESSDYKDTLYKPRNNVAIVTIADGEVPIFIIPENEKFDECHLYSRDGHPLILSIMVNPGQTSKFFKRDVTWREINEKQFETRRKSIKGELSGYTLDIMNPDEDKVTVSQRKDKGRDYTGYTPKEGSSIISVMESGKEIWTAGVDEYYSFACMYSREGHYPLLNLTYRDPCERSSALCFEKGLDGWTSIDANNFTTKLEQMADKEDK